MLFRYNHNGKIYTFHYDSGDYIRIVCNDSGKETRLRVIPSDDFRIKLNKKTVSAVNGARGLFAFLFDAVRENFMTAYVNLIIDRYCA